MRGLDLTGQKFERLTALEVRLNGRGQRRWLCRCDCGNELLVTLGNLRNGHTRSCGCLFQSLRGENNCNYKHGKSRSKAYPIWKSMRVRCTLKTRPEYPRYGGKGITVCDRWNSFENFLNDMGEPPPGASLDRINNEQGYSPDNCRWASNREQCRNRRSNVQVTYKGKTKILIEWCEELGLPYTRTRRRLAKGWSPEKAFTLPPRDWSAGLIEELLQE